MNIYEAIRQRYAAIGYGLAIARGRPVSSSRESPEDIKWCPACGDHHIMLDDEMVQGPINRLYHLFCPVCVDEHEKNLEELSRTYYAAKETIGDAV